MIFPCRERNETPDEAAQRVGATRARTAKPVSEAAAAPRKAKAPYGGRGFLDAKAGTIALGYWLDGSSYSRALVGLPLSRSRVLILDLDRHDPAVDGVRNGAAILASWGIIPTLWVRTASGGLHVLVEAPPGVDFGNRTPAAWAGLGIDVRGPQADGSARGYVIAAGSRLADGAAWVANDPNRVLTAFATGAGAPAMPPEMAALWHVEERSVTITRPTAAELAAAGFGEEGFAEGEKGEEGRRALAFLATWEPPDTFGGNNVNAARAFRVGALVRGLYCDEQAAVDALLATSTQTDHDHAERTIRRQIEAGADRAADWEPEQHNRPMAEIWGCEVRDPTPEETAVETAARQREAVPGAPPPVRVITSADAPPRFADTGAPISTPMGPRHFFAEPLGGDDLRIPGGKSSVLYRLMRGIAPRLYRLSDPFCFTSALAIASTIVSQHCAGPSLSADVGTIPRLFLGLVAPTGAGKDAPVKVAAEMIEEVCPGVFNPEGERMRSKMLLNTGGFASAIALIEYIHKREGASTLLAMPEGSALFAGKGSTVDRNRADVVSTLLQLWDGRGAVTSRASKASGPGIVVSDSAVNILLGTNETLLGETMDRTSAASGLLARFVWIFPEGETRKAPPRPAATIVGDDGATITTRDRSSDADAKARWDVAVAAVRGMLDEGRRFADAARREGRLAGSDARPFGAMRVDYQSAAVVLAERALVDWCSSITSHGEAGEYQTAAANLFVRAPQIAIRLAVISARCRGKRHIDPSDFRWGARIALKSAHAAFLLATERLDSGGGIVDRFERTERKLILAMRDAPRGFLSHRELARRVRGADFKRALEGLIGAGVLMPSKDTSSRGERGPAPVGYVLDEVRYLLPPMSPDLLGFLLSPGVELPRPTTADELVRIAEEVDHCIATDPRMKSALPAGVVDYDSPITDEERQEAGAARLQVWATPPAPGFAPPTTAPFTVPPASPPTAGFNPFAAHGSGAVAAAPSRSAVFPALAALQATTATRH